MSRDSADPDHTSSALALRVARARSFLFVPGDRPTRFRSALASTSDVVVVDLEDAVAPDAKEGARTQVVELLEQQPGVLVRTNPPSTPHGRADLAALRGVRSAVGVMLSKCETEADIAAVRTALGDEAVVVPLLETASGVRNADAVARCHGVVRLAFGSLDYALDCGCDHEREALLLARSSLVVASRAAGLPQPVDGVTARLGDPDLLADDSSYARRLGFGGKLCIHPEQTDAVNSGFAPSADQIAWARHILTTIDGGQHGAVRVNDTMVDEPVRQRALRIVRSAGPSPSAAQLSETDHGREHTRGQI